MVWLRAVQVSTKSDFLITLLPTTLLLTLLPTTLSLTLLPTTLVPALLLTPLCYLHLPHIYIVSFLHRSINGFCKQCPDGSKDELWTKTVQSPSCLH